MRERAVLRARACHARSVTIDGFEAREARAFGAFDARAADRAYGWVDRVARRFGVEVDGIERLPEGRALVVGNHTFGWDVTFPMAAVWRTRRRPLWALGEHAWWAVPFVRRIVAAVGTVDGTPENVDRLLSAGELVLVLPGGLREAVKPRELRYQLLWGRRYGFVRAAIRNRAPIVPLACIGADDLFDFVGNAYERGARWLGRPGFPIPFPTRMLPIPRRSRFRFVFGEPIETGAEPAQCDDPKVLRRVRHEVAGALHELIENELARRAGIDVGADDA